MKYIPLFNLAILGLLAFLSILTLPKFKRNELPWKIISIYIVGSFIAQGVAHGYWEMKWNNLKILHIYSLFQFVAFSAFYRSITVRKTKRLLIMLFSSAISLFLVLNSIWFESLQDFNSLGVFISYGTIIVFAVSHFFEVLGADTSTKKYLIINSGILLFVSESLVIFLFGNFLKNIAQIYQTGLWYTHGATNILF